MHWRLEVFPTLPSTQDFIKEAARQGQDEGLAVQAVEQSAGRGRQGRVWQSDAGNLFLSVLLRPHCNAEQVGEIALLAGLVLARLGAALTGVQPLLKWPNDVLIGGRKCAGILVETGGLQKGRVEWAALGVGLNVAHAPLAEASSLAVYGYQGTLAQARDHILQDLGSIYTSWKQDGFSPIYDQIQPFLPPRGMAIRAYDGQSYHEGAFDGLDAQGKLLLRFPGGALKTISAGEIFI